MKRALLVVALAFLSGCSWVSTANIQYEPFNAFTERPEGKFKQMGRVADDGHSHYLGFCERAAHFALQDAITEAIALGANALGDVKWITNGGEWETPHCNSSFYFIWWGSSAALSASALKVDGLETPSTEHPDALTFDPERPVDESAREMLAQIVAKHGEPVDVAEWRAQ